jgi:glycine cleavage system H protein
MLPWNYGFHWNTGTILFMGAFYSVLTIVAATLLRAGWRWRRSLRPARVEQIRWRSDFHDLPKRDRDCRHVLTGELEKRTCPNAFDCRKCETHAKLVEMAAALPKTAPAEEEIFGMSFPLDRAYHRGHTWARREPDGTITIGLDDLGRRLLNGPDDLMLPEPGAELAANGTAWRARKKGAEVRVLSPVDGEVVETGGPDQGWYLRVRPTRDNFRHLLRGSDVRPWIAREIERLQLALCAEGAQPTMADGGVPVEDISTACPAREWDAVCASMFLNS